MSNTDINKTSFTNSTQVQTTTATIVGIAAGYLASKTNLSISDWTTILVGLISVGTVVWPLIITRAQALKNTVGNMPKTTVVTDAASANALPDNPSVVAVTPAISDAIKKAA